MRRWTFCCALVIALAWGGITNAATRHYTIVVGDTLSDIALRFDCALEELMLDNELVNDHIVVGHRLRLPPPAFMTRKADQQPITLVTHVVEEGDSLGSIAARYRTTVHAVKVWNVMPTDQIRVGQKIAVPAVGAIPKRESFTYAVEPGDSIRTISEHFDIPQRVIKRLNKDQDFTRLLIGDEMVLYRDVYVDPKPPAKPVPTITPAPEAPSAEAPAVATPAPTTAPMPKKVTAERP